MVNDDPKIFERLTSETYELYAARHYDNPGCVDIKEFKSDLELVDTVIRQFGKFTFSTFNTRQVINNIQILLNVFGSDATIKLVAFRMNPDLKPKYLPIFKSVMVFMNSVPAKSELYRVSADKTFLQSLRELEE